MSISISGTNGYPLITFRMKDGNLDRAEVAGNTAEENAAFTERITTGRVAKEISAKMDIISKGNSPKYDTSNINPPPIVVGPIIPGEWDKYTLENDKKYIDIFRNMALGTETDSGYKYVFADKTIELFGDKADHDAIVQQLNAMIEEIKNNFATGVANPTANLKTKFTISGVEFSYDEMMAAREKMQYAHDLAGGNSSKDYTAYAEMGASIGYIKNYSKGLDSQQALLLNKKITEHVEHIISLAEQYNVGKAPNPNEEDREFYAYEKSSNATNREYTGALVKLFAELDFSDKSAVETALLRYQKLIGESMTDMYKHTNAEKGLMGGWLKDLADMQKNRLEGNFKFSHNTLTSLKKEIEKVNALRKASLEADTARRYAVERPKSPDEIILDYVKGAYNSDTSTSSPSSHYAEFGKNMLETYRFIADQHKNFGDWAKYYRDSMQEGSNIKKRAAEYSDRDVELFKGNYRYNNLENLMSATLTSDEEALAYRAYGDAFLTKKAEYYDKAQKSVEEYGYLMGKQYATAAKMLNRKVQDEYGADDMEMFKLEFHRESFLNNTSGKSFMEQLMLAIQSIEKQIEALNEQETSVRA